MKILGSTAKVHVYKTTRGYNNALRRIFDDHSGEFDGFAGLSYDGHILVNEEVCDKHEYRACCVLHHEIGHSLVDQGTIPLEVPSDPNLEREFRQRHPENSPPNWAKHDPTDWLRHEIIATAIEVAKCTCGSLREQYPNLARFGDSLIAA